MINKYLCLIYQNSSRSENCFCTIYLQNYFLAHNHIFPAVIQSGHILPYLLCKTSSQNENYRRKYLYNNLYDRWTFLLEINLFLYTNVVFQINIYILYGKTQHNNVFIFL